MEKVGYRTYICGDRAIDFIKKYSIFFNVMEVKTTKRFIESIRMDKLFHLCELCGIETISFQLPSKTFINEEECGLACDLMMGIENGNGTCLVTKFWGNAILSQMHCYAVNKLAKERNFTIVLENVAVRKNLTKYLEILKEFAIEHDFKVCLDLATLFYSIRACKTTFEAVIGYLKKDPWWRANIVEVHVHDYTKDGCHLNMGDGLMYEYFWNVRDLFECFNDECVFIFETGIQDLECQALAEVSEFKEHLKK